MSYCTEVLERVKTRYAYEPEFVQAVEEFLDSLRPVLEIGEERLRREKILERLIEPDRLIQFRVSWVDDMGGIQVNTGYRVQFNNALGPYKGGLRFRDNVNGGIIKFLGFEQTFKNALTGLPIGGGKGGSDFDPKGKSDREVMAFCKAFISELYHHLGADTDIPAGDIGVGAREVGYMFGQFKRLTHTYEGVFTGKSLVYGGSLGRKEATGYGLLYFTDCMLKDAGLSLQGKKIIISGSGNVAIYAAQKAVELGGIVVAMSDSSGYIHAPNGIDLELMKEIKEARKERICAYADEDHQASFHSGKGIWTLPCQVALPCATQNELDLADAQQLVANGCLAVAEGANMPTSYEAVKYFQANDVLYAPGKATNAGGVAVSCLEMSQNSQRLSWTFEEVDGQLKKIMTNIFLKSAAAAAKYGRPKDYVLGANAAGFEKVVEAMEWQGV